MMQESEVEMLHWNLLDYSVCFAAFVLGLTSESILNARRVMCNRQSAEIARLKSQISKERHQFQMLMAEKERLAHLLRNRPITSSKL